MAINENVAKVLEDQINKELYSAYLYLTFADYYEDRGLKGFANWYMVQVQEETDHVKALRRYLLDNDYKPTMEAIDKPDKTFANDLEPLEAGLRAMQMLDWFVKEQGEEEANARDMISNMKLFGTDPKGLYDLDREYATRTYIAQTTLPM